jgi:predicted  nucleic acid-binding Zn-ribbon protein
MKISILSALLAVACAATAGALEPPPATLESLDREVQALTDQLREEVQKTAEIQQRLDAIEDRLGPSYGGSPFDTIERRLEELEKDVNDLGRGR